MLWHKMEILDRMTPASGTHNEINFNTNRKRLSDGYKLCQQNGHELWHTTSIFSIWLILVISHDR
jgi:hypothetical protein